MELRTALGQHLVTGFTGPDLTDDLVECIREFKIGNIILFESNVTDKAQLKRLCAELASLIRSETGYPPFITMDQEGGVVSRLQEDATLFPSAMAIAAGGNPDNARIAGLITAEELRAMGVNFDLAPVLDVSSNPQNPVIGVRSYGDDPAKVATYGIAMAQGLGEGGVFCALKHFPGHGDTSIDSHLGLPCIEKSLDALLACELIPFQEAIDAGVPAVMTSHILFPSLEPEPLPATMSRRIITDLLKTRMGFRGLVLSDCMMMGAIDRYYGAVAGSIAAVRAGVDLVFVSHSPTLAARVLHCLQTEVEQGRISRTELDASTEKILRYKATLRTDAPSLDTVGCRSHREESARMTAAAITLVQDAPFALGAMPLFMGPCRFRPTLVSSPEDTGLRFSEVMRSLLCGHSLMVPENPTAEEIAQALEPVQGHTSVVIGTFQARQREGQLALVREVIKLGLPICVVALRDPYDLAGLPAHVRALAAYDYDRRTLPVVADMLAGRAQPTGTLPVHLG